MILKPMMFQSEVLSGCKIRANPYLVIGAFS